MNLFSSVSFFTWFDYIHVIFRGLVCFHTVIFTHHLFSRGIFIAHFHGIFFKRMFFFFFFYTQFISFSRDSFYTIIHLLSWIFTFLFYSRIVYYVMFTQLIFLFHVWLWHMMHFSRDRVWSQRFEKSHWSFMLKYSFACFSHD